MADLGPPDIVAPDLEPTDDGAPDPLPGFWKILNAGTFQMGSTTQESCRSGNERQHKVTLTHRILFMSTEVTQSQFSALMGYNPSYFSSCGSTCPVEQVSWYQAAAYANALSAKEGLKACYVCMGTGQNMNCIEATAFAGTKVYTCPGYRLPTEAEWEYAYRAGTNTAFYSGGITSCGSTDSNLDKIGWYKENSQVAYAGSFTGRGTHPVGQKSSNAWGLYDMAGNVEEWCHDMPGGYPSAGATDPVGTSGYEIAARGGGWSDIPKFHRAASRSRWMPGAFDYRLGFRLARSVQ